MHEREDIARVRCWLFVPAHDDQKIAKSLMLGADAIILDLEDGVGSSAKAIARQNVSNVLSQTRAAGVPIWVRVSPDHLDLDLDAAARPGIGGICLAKAEISSVLELDSRLTRLESDQEMPCAGIRVMALIETARGVLAAAAIAGAPRVVVLQLGEQDLRADLGLAPSTYDGGPIPDALATARGSLVIASSAQRICAPIAPVCIKVDDPNLSVETSRFRQCGFQSRAVIHPGQIPPVLEGFMPTHEEIEWSVGVMDAVVAPLPAVGAVRDRSGNMVDLPVIRQAQAILRMAGLS